MIAIVAFIPRQNCPDASPDHGPGCISSIRLASRNGSGQPHFLMRQATLSNRLRTQLFIATREALMLPTMTTSGWSSDWMWGISLIALSVVTHAAGLALIAIGLIKILGPINDSQLRLHRRFIFFSLVVGVTAVLLAVMHGIEASYWAISYVWLGALPDFRRAIYFSLQMATTLGGDVVQLEDHWKLMGPLEAISGMLLFGLSTAFLFAIMLRAWPFQQGMRGESG
jgi:hypothetical protein